MGQPDAFVDLVRLDVRPEEQPAPEDRSEHALGIDADDGTVDDESCGCGQLPASECVRRDAPGVRSSSRDLPISSVLRAMSGARDAAMVVERHETRGTTRQATAALPATRADTLNP